MFAASARDMRRNLPPGKKRTEDAPLLAPRAAGVIIAYFSLL
jgi:hypothetical protein